MVLDVLIIGAGPIGLNCAIEAKKAGLNCLVIEKGVLVNSLFNFPTNMTFFSTSQLLEIGEVPFIAHGDKPTRRESLEYFRRVKESWNLKIHLYEEVLQLEKQAEGFYKIQTSKNSYESKSIIIATGFYDTPRKLGIKGEDLPKVKHYYDEPHPYVGQKLLVIGAKNSACDVALETYHKGAEVTLVHRGAEIGPNVKYWIRPNIVNRIKEESIKAYFHTTVKEILPSEVVLATPNGEVKVENDFVLAMTGYKPNYHFLEKIGLNFEADKYRTPIQNPNTLETNLPNVYIAGVASAGLNTSKLFIENTRIHAEMIIQAIQSKKK